MGVFDVQGNELNAVYDVNGVQLSQVYDVEGNPLLGDLPLVVMSYNIQRFSGLNSNLNMQKEILATYNPLIIGMQEFNSTLGDLLSEYIYSYKAVATGTTSAIASKVVLNDVEATPYVNQAPSGSSRYQKCYFSYNGKNICWINVHLATSDYRSVKTAQAKEVFDLVENEEYFIITGDFNTVCKSVNDSEYTSIMKQFIDAGYNSANCSEQHGFLDTWTSGSTASGTWYPCDHVITSANITIDNVFVDTRKIDVAESTGQSIDHLPIIAYLTVN